MKEKEILQVLPKKIAKAILDKKPDFDKMQEIRLRAGKPLIYLYDGRERLFRGENGEYHFVTKEEMREMLEYMSNYSRYAYENEFRQGFITLEGGHRAGLSGQAVIENEKVKTLKYISGVNVRIAHEIKGCAEKVMPHIIEEGNVCHTLIISPPGCGKTTLLRDVIRLTSDGCKGLKGRTVGVVDERSEIAGCYRGIPQNEIGIRTDVLDACPKAEGMLMMIRSMAPRVLAVDEIGAKEDVRALEYAICCGLKILATAHGASFEEIKQKPLFRELVNEKRFERYVILEGKAGIGRTRRIYDGEGEILYADDD